jgi:ATP-dependent DNA helicase RecG
MWLNKFVVGKIAERIVMNELEVRGYRASKSLHGELLAAVRDDVRGGTAASKSARGEALMVLLYLFEQDETLRYLRTG